MSPLLLAVLLCLIGLGCVLAVLLGLPGTWMLLALGVGIELTDAWWAGPDTTSIGWPVLGVAFLLALVGEGIEFLSGTWGTKAGGGSRRASVGAFFGGMVGGIVGTLVLPVIGTLVGALLGTFAGAFYGETTGDAARDRKEAVKPAITATIGRLLGTIAKVGVAVMVWMMISVAAIWSAWPS